MQGEFLAVESEVIPIAKQYYAILMVSDFSSAGSEFIRTISDSVGYIKVDPGKVDCGQISIDEDTALLLIDEQVLFKFKSFTYLSSDVTLIGLMTIFNNADSSTFRKIKSLADTFKAYAPIPYMFICNPQDTYTFNLTTHKTLTIPRDEAWDVEDVKHYLRLPDEIPMMLCDVKNRAETKAALLLMLQTIEQAISDGKYEIEQTEPSSIEVLPEEPFKVQRK
jgi:signal recognition particle receptor subunit beta